MDKFIYERATYKVAFRLEGGHHLGIGHVVRCLAVARELNKRISVNILFIINNSSEIISLIEKDNFPFKVYFHNETDEVYNILYEYNPHIIVNDLPCSSVEYMEKIKTLCPTINYDDGGGGCIHADYLIHVTYKTFTRLLGNKGYIYGPEYLILRDEFFLHRVKASYRIINNDGLKILITMGGSDPANLTIRALKDIQKIKNHLEIKIITGVGYRYHTELEQCIRESKHKVFLYKNVNVDQLLNLMTQADIGIVHYGITAYEMACVGLPFVAIAHNSDEFTKNRLIEYGFCLDAGLCDNLNESDIPFCVNKLLNNKKFREQLSKNGMNRVDAKGLIRIVNLVIDVLEKRA
ncbi:MAG: PseG/SpsG family protein [Bacilli bacterium]